MKHRAVATLTALAVVVAGAWAVPPVDVGPASDAVDAAPPPTVGAPIQSLDMTPGLDDPISPPHESRTVDLGALTPQSKRSHSGDGALATVLGAIADGDGIPDGLSEQVRLTGDRIRVEVAHTDAASARAAVVDAGGRDIAVVTDALLAADVPLDAIAELDAAPSVTGVALPSLAAVAPDSIAAVPATVGVQGGDVYAKTKMSRWHKLGLRGSGIAVGIVDYFDGVAWEDARGRGELPDPAGVFCRRGGQKCDVFANPSSDIHGVAVAEAIHDMAPKARLYLATVTTKEDLKKAIDYFASQGVRILSRSLGGFFDGPGDGTGASADLVDYAVKKGIAWFNSAGNSGASTVTYSNGTKAWAGGYWRDTWRDTNANGWHEFAAYEVDQTTGQRTGAITYSETMFVNCSPYFRLRWNDWGTGSPTDYDIYRINNGAVLAPGYSPNTQKTVTDAPLELQDGSSSYFRCTPGDWIEVGIYLDSAGSGTADDILELQGNSRDIYKTATSPYSSSAAFNDSRNPGMAIVGAVDPVDGTLIAGYSSQGPTNDGRVKPELSAGSNFTSRAYEATGQGGRFNGTSAATPVVAGAAAVVLERYSSKTPKQLIDYLRTRLTTDRGEAGVDYVYGSGELIMTALKAATFTSTPAPKITGTRAVGSTLKATATWKPAVKSAKYQWYRSGKAIAGATKKTYKLVTADAGKKILVKVTGSRPGFTPVKKSSAYTGAIAKVFTKAPAPKISGTAKVGRTLTAVVGTWSPKYSKVTYQWKRGGTAIKGATKKTYSLKSADAGRRITVTVKVTKSGYLTTSKTSGKTGKIAR